MQNLHRLKDAFTTILLIEAAHCSSLTSLRTLLTWQKTSSPPSTEIKTNA